MATGTFWKKWFARNLDMDTLLFFILALLLTIVVGNHFLPQLEGFREGMTFNDAINKLNSLSGDIRNLADNANKIPGTINSVTTELNGVVNKVSGAIDTKINSVSSVFEKKLKDLGDVTTGLVNQAKGELTTNITRAANAGAGALSKAQGELQGKINQAAATVKSLINDLRKEFNGAMAAAQREATRMLNEAKKEFQEKLKEAREAANAAIATIREQFRELEKKITDMVKEATKAFNDALKQIEGKMNQLIGELRKEFNKAIGEVKDAAKEAEKGFNKTIGEIRSQIKSLDDRITNLGDFFTKTLRSVFIQIGDKFDKAFVNPMSILFEGIGNIFVQVFNIIKMVGDKIVSLPNCILTYAMKSTTDTIYATYKYIFPDFITNTLDWIYRYTLGIIVNFLADFFGYTAQIRKCYGFNVDDQVNSMKDKFGDIARVFKQDFGKINFNDIKLK